MSGRLTSIELKSLEWYKTKYKLRLKLSTYPVMYFRNIKTDEELKVSILGIVREYKDAHKEDMAEKARLKKIEKDLETKANQRRVI